MKKLLIMMIVALYSAAGWCQNGTETNPFTCAEANAFVAGLAADTPTETEYYVKGKVSQMQENFSYKYGNATFYISDDGTKNGEFYVYRTKYFEGANYAGGRVPNIGDEVVFCGKLVNYKGLTPETASGKCRLVSINDKTTNRPIEKNDLFDAVTDGDVEMYFVAGCMTEPGKPSNNTNIGCSVGYAVSNNPATYSGAPTAIDANYEGAVTIPEMMEELEVRTVAPSAFAGAKLSSISIPATVWDIETDAFKDCQNLTSVTLPEGVILNAGSFQNCTALTSVGLPKGVQLYGYESGTTIFGGCTNLTAITVNDETPYSLQGSYLVDEPSNVTLYVPIGSKAAYQAADYWKDFDKIVEGIPSPIIVFADANVKALCVANWDTNGDGELSEAEAAAVTSLDEVFKENKQITSFNELQFFTGLTSIGDYAFQKCEALETIIIPEGVTTIGQNAFSGCYHLGSVKIPNSVTTIKGAAFVACNNLTTIILPKGLTSIGSSAFYGCAKLESINLLETKITSISDNLFWACDALASISIPAGVTTIGKSAFEDCDVLSNVNLPNGLEIISEGAFFACDALASIDIPNSVTTIGKQAFQECIGLTSVTVGKAVPVEITSDTFFNPANITLYVPEDSKAAYQAADCWKDFGKIIGYGYGTAFGSPEKSIVAGTTLEFEDYTVTYGETGSPDFQIVTDPIIVPLFGGTQQVTWNNYIAGNGVSGNKPGGTFYLIHPTFNCTMNIYVRQNAGKELYVEESGRVMEAFNGITHDEIYVGKYAIPMKANLTYKIYCRGSKLGFYGMQAYWTDEDELDAINIAFADDKVKALCVASWDANGDGQLSDAEAATVTTLGEVFKYNEEITSFNELQYFTGLADIADHAFAGCTALKSVVLPGTVTHIYDSAFEGCSQLESVDFNGCKAAIHSMAFFECRSLTSLVLPAGCYPDGYSVFNGCSALLSVEMKPCDNPVEMWSSDVFAECNNLKTATVYGRYLHGPGNFRNCSSLTTVTYLDDIPGNSFNQNFQGVPADVQFVISDGSAETFLHNGYFNLSDKSGLGMVRDEFEAEVARVAKIATALASGDATTLQTAISEARTVVNDATDYADVLGQIDVIKQAARDFLATNELAKEVDVTGAFILNPDFDRFDRGWQAPTGWIASGYQDGHCENGDVVIDKFIQIWHSEWIDDHDAPSVLDDYKLSQTIPQLPAGNYRLEADAIASWSTDDRDITGAYLFIGDEQVPVTTLHGKPQHFSVEFTNSAIQNVEIGMKTLSTNANWVAFDNVRLTYLGAKETDTEDYMIDYADYSGFPFYVMGYVPEWVDGVMTDYGAMYVYKTEAEEGNNVVGVVSTSEGIEYQKILLAEPGWHQYFLADGIRTEYGGNYIVKAKIRASEPCEINVNMGWGWEEGQHASAMVSIPATDEFVEVEWTYRDVLGYSCNLVAQPGNSTATIEWKWLTVSHEKKDQPEVDLTEQLTNGDAERQWTTEEKETRYDDTANNYRICAWGRENGRNVAADGDSKPFPADIVEVEDGNHAFVVHAQNCTDPESEASAWDNQFWIQSPKSWPTGTKVKVHFRYKASQEVLTTTQVHGQTPGDYIDWHGIGDIAFTTQWQEYDGFMGIADDMDGTWSIAFCLNAQVKTAVDFYFDDLSWQVLESTDISTLTDAIYADDVTGSRGSTTNLTVSLKNAQATNAYSFDLKLPEGVTVAKDNDDEYIYTLSDRHKGHTVESHYNETTGVYSFAVLSVQSRQLTGNDGAIMTLTLNVADDIALGEYSVKIQNAIYSLPLGDKTVSLPETISKLSIENYVKGDANGDGKVDIADAVCIVNHVVGKPTPAFNIKAADANGDGSVDIADAVRIVNLIVGKISALAPRFGWNLPEPE